MKIAGALWTGIDRAVAKYLSIYNVSLRDRYLRKNYMGHNKKKQKKVTLRTTNIDVKVIQGV